MNEVKTLSPPYSLKLKVVAGQLPPPLEEIQVTTELTIEYHEKERSYVIADKSSSFFICIYLEERTDEKLHTMLDYDDDEVKFNGYFTNEKNVIQQFEGAALLKMNGSIRCDTKQFVNFFIELDPVPSL